MALVISWLRQYYQAKELPGHLWSARPFYNRYNRYQRQVAKYKKKHTLNILLVVGCVLSIEADFLVSVKSAGTTAAPTTQVETTILPSLSPLDINSSALPQDRITRLLQIETNIPERPNDRVTEYFVQRGDSPWSVAQKLGLNPETILFYKEWDCYSDKQLCLP